jgi:hypothetical protein
MIDKVFSEKKINFYNAKPTFAKLLTDKYDLVVNIDSDHVITGRMEAILEGNYDVACPTNLNDYENASFDNITNEMYLQGGLVASTSKTFWDTWEKQNRLADLYIRKENDVMNKVIYDNKFKLKILDKDYGYYGCKSLNREGEFYLEGKKVMCRKEQVFAYHHAKGAVFPKLNFDKMGFSREVRDYLWYISTGFINSEVHNGV